MRWAVLLFPLLSGCFLDRSGIVDWGDDAGPVEMDAGRMDAGRADAGPVDAGPGDAGTRDAGPPDAGRDAGMDSCIASAELCDGLDNDCDPASQDGADESQLGMQCDGPDGDDCRDDTFSCTGGALSCSTGDDDVEICNAIDDDCDGVVDNGAGCPCRLERYGGHVYLFCGAASWATARDSCPTGYRLVKIDDAAEQAFLEGITAMIANVDFWIGGAYGGSPARYRWIADGTSIPLPGDGGYENWGPGFDGSGSCVEMDGDTSSGGARWTWNDAPCGDSQRYICETR